VRNVAATTTESLRNRGVLIIFCVVMFVVAGCGKDNPVKSSVARPRLQICDYGLVIFFGAGGDSDRIRLLGWAPTEGGYTWTDGIGASLGLRLPASAYPVRLSLKAAGMNDEVRLPFQPVDVAVNGEKIASWQVAEEKTYTAIIPRRFVAAPETFLLIDFYMPKVASPASLGHGPDSRRLGMRVVDLRFDKAPEAAANR